MVTPGQLLDSILEDWVEFASFPWDNHMLQDAQPKPPTIKQVRCTPDHSKTKGDLEAKATGEVQVGVGAGGRGFICRSKAWPSIRDPETGMWMGGTFKLANLGLALDKLGVRTQFL